MLDKTLLRIGMWLERLRRHRAETPDVGWARRIEFNPGDIAVLQFDGNLSEKQVDRLRAQWEEHFRGVGLEQVIILEGDWEITVLGRNQGRGGKTPLLQEG